MKIVKSIFFTCGQQKLPFFSICIIINDGDRKYIKKNTILIIYLNHGKPPSMN